MMPTFISRYKPPLHSPYQISHLKLVGVVVMAFVIMAIIQQSLLGSELRYRSETVSYFNLRDRLTYTPELMPNVQIFVYDDPTVANTARFDLSQTDWINVLKAIDQRHPAAIVVVADQATLYNLAKMEGLQFSLLQIDSPLFFTNPLTQQTPFSHYTKQSFFAEPWPSHTSEQLKRYRGELLQQDYPENTLISLLPRATLIDRSYNMVALISRAASGASIDPVQVGDYVLLIPKMYTGATRWHDTPLGHMQEGFVIVSALNSFLTRTWLFEDRWAIAKLALACAAGYSLAYFTSGLWLGLFSFVAIIVIGLSGLGMFLTYGILSSVVFPVVGLGLSAFIVFSDRFRLSFLESRRISQELETSGFVQESFLLAPRAACEFLQVHPHLESASECSGDWWTGIVLNQDRYMLIVTDAVGHGMPAALMTAMAHAGCHTLEQLVHSEIALEVTPSSLLTMMNDVFYQTMHTKFHLTGTALLFDRSHRRLTIASAGHAPPYLVSSNPPKVKPLLVRGAPLAVDQAPIYQEKSFELSYGERVIIYTDGLYEAPNAKGAEYGKRRLRSMIEQYSCLSTANLVESLAIDVAVHRGSAPPKDDITLLVVEFTES